MSPMPQSSLIRRVAGGAYLIVAALIIAHGINAFVADALYVPLNIPNVSGATPNPIDAPHPYESQQSAEYILQNGLFELPPSAQLTKDGGPVAAPPPIEAARKVALIGGVYGKTGGVMAVLEDLTLKQQALYRLGAEIPNVGTLAAIEKDRVLFKNGPSEEWLPLALTQQMQNGFTDLAPVPVKLQATPSRRVLDRREVTATLNDPTRLMTQVLAVPYLADGKLDGFRLYNVMPLGFFDKIGLRTNDIVQRINGVELRDPGMLLSLFQQLRSENTVRVDLVRNNQHQTLAYDIR